MTLKTMNEQKQQKQPMTWQEIEFNQEQDTKRIKSYVAAFFGFALFTCVMATCVKMVSGVRVTHPPVTIQKP